MFKIISDAACDFTEVEAAQHEVELVPFYVSFDNEFLKIGTDITTQEFFTRLQNDKGVFPTTSQPNPGDYVEVYTPHLEAGNDLIVLTISSKLSGSYNSARIAADLMQEEFPERNIVVMDSTTGSIAQGLILRELVAMRDAGLTLEKAAEIGEKVRDSSKIYVTLDTLEYVKRGGRMGSTTAMIGGLLALRPILHVVDGTLAQLESIRGKKNVLRLLQEGTVQALSDEKGNINVALGHIFSEKDVLLFKANLENALDISIDTPITEIGAVIGAHAGPGALAIAYCKKYQAVAGGE